MNYDAPASDPRSSSECVPPTSRSATYEPEPLNTRELEQADEDVAIEACITRTSQWHAAGFLVEHTEGSTLARVNGVLKDKTELLALGRALMGAVLEIENG